MVMILAHRGAGTGWGHSGARENTIEAFRHARRLGADGVELDVRMSADGALVVHHDAAIDGVGAIAHRRCADLPPYVPSLDSALAVCSELVVNIELKELPGEPGYDPDYHMAQLVAQLAARRVADRGWAGQVIISSFDLLALDTALDTEPTLVTGWLTPNWFDQGAALETVLERGHRALHAQHDGVTDALVAAAHQAGISIAAWTADDPEEIRRLAGAGVDTIITNFPDRARAALSA